MPWLGHSLDNRQTLLCWTFVTNCAVQFLFWFFFVVLFCFVHSFFFSLSEIVFWHKQINLLFSFLRPASRVTPPFIQ